MVPERCNLDFIVEVSDVADDGHVLHLPDVVDPDHIPVAGCSNEYVAFRRRLFKGDHIEPVHRRLQGTDRVGFRDLDAGASPPQGSR